MQLITDSVLPNKNTKWKINFLQIKKKNYFEATKANVTSKKIF